MRMAMIMIFGMFAYMMFGYAVYAAVDDEKTFSIQSTSFGTNEGIPEKHTCEGKDVSPFLEWKDAPEGTKSFALIVDDPDAPVGTWVHWVAWNIPAPKKELKENVAKRKSLPDGTRQGTNDFKKIGYNGPCPPPGKPHRYFFKLYALDGKLDLKPGATKAELLDAMKGHILAQAELMGTYQR